MGTRLKVTVGKKRIYRAHAIWNDAYPNDPIIPGEVIHHKDGIKSNDSPSNLEKMTDFDHRKLHSHHGTEALKKWRAENPKRARKQSQANAKKLRDRLRSDPVLAERTRKAQREGTIKSNKARALNPEERKRRLADYMCKYRRRKKKGGGAL